MPKMPENQNSKSRNDAGKDTKAWSPGADYFKKTFSNPASAGEFLGVHLPPDLKSALNLDSLTLSPDTYVTDWLTEIRADVVYELRTQAGEELNVCFLIEHKGDNPEQEQPLYLQLLKYMVHAWDLQWQNGRRTLRPIIPVVVYTGAKGWNPKAPMDLFGLSRQTEVMYRFIPQVPFILENLRSRTTEEIDSLYRAADLSLMFRLFYAKIKNLLTDEHLLAILEKSGEKLGNEERVFQDAYVYLSYVFGNRERERFRSFLKWAQESTKNTAMESAMKYYIQTEFADELAAGRAEAAAKAAAEAAEAAAAKAADKTRGAIVRALRMGKLELEDIASMMEVSVAEVLAIKEEEGL